MKGYRLGTIKIDNSNQEIKLNGAINESEFLVLSEHTKNLFAFKSQQELHSIFIINFLEFNNLFEQTIHKLLKLKLDRALLDENPKELKFISRNANRLFLNFLSSGRTFLDHTETYLKRKYGKQSPEFIKFKNETTKLYDNSFEYRFMYKLRNYAQHCGLPINNITFSINNEIQENVYNRKYNLNPTFIKQELLDSYEEWGTQLKNDFKQKPEEISVISVIKEYYKNIDELSQTLLAIEEDSLQTSIDYLENFTKRFGELEQKGNIQLCVFFNFELSKPDSYENSKFETYKLPLNLITEIKKKLQPTRGHSACG
ncbi:hypothetical protein ACE01N_19960 [Saccharicrinis sp. FJH2]|uniref:hypothetical protein n=1 Tax=Saccharicrinis sp. FJH65 TaxID=3344659 RepID=UPI0035F4A44B